MSTNLAAKFAALKEQANTSLSSPEHASIPTPLATFLYIYSLATYECYIDYMHGAKALAKFLAPIEIPAPRYDIRKYPNLLCSYTTNELSKIIASYATEKIPSAVVSQIIIQATYESILPILATKGT